MIAPYPYFGGKRSIAPMVWPRLGPDVRNYVEPFLGSAAMLLSRPGWSADAPWIETVNDAHGFIPNFWRAVQQDPDAVAYHADWPVSECDLHARHLRMVEQAKAMDVRLMADPDWCDPQIAGWWVWGMACWIGSGFCKGDGPWHAEDQPDGSRQLVHLGDAGQGVHRQLVHLGDAGQGVHRQRVHLGNAGQGVHRQRVHLGNAGRGNAGDGEQGLLAWMRALSARFQRVRVCCGDWERVCGPTPTVKQGLTAVFLDPPYAESVGRDMVYTKDDGDVANRVRQWCLDRGGDPRIRIALCGYAGEHEALAAAGWDAAPWKAKGGYGSQGTETRGRDNAKREVVWFSPHCVPTKAKQQPGFLDGAV